jgi:hypothetical protein
MRGASRVLMGKPDGRRRIGRLGDRRIIIKWIFKKCGGGGRGLD